MRGTVRENGRRLVSRDARWTTPPLRGGDYSILAVTLCPFPLFKPGSRVGPTAIIPSSAQGLAGAPEGSSPAPCWGHAAFPAKRGGKLTM